MATCLGCSTSTRHQDKETDPWNLPPRSSICYSSSLPVFTAPTYQTFVAIVAGWVLSQRHRFITEVIFSSGNVGNGHWSRFHRFFSHAAWDIDTFSLALAKLVVTILAPGALLLWAVDDTLCRKRGLTLYGAGMHYDPLISSRSKSSGQLGTRLGRALSDHRPSLLGAHQGLRLAHRRAGCTSTARDSPRGRSARGNRPGPRPRAKAKADPNHRTRPELALELINLVARWFPDR